MSRSSITILNRKRSVLRKDLDAGHVDFSDLSTGRRLRPVHPGRILELEFIDPMGMSVSGLARAIRVSRSRLSEVVLGRRPMRADMALRLARYFGTSAGLWLNLQTQHDLEVAQRTLRGRIDREISPRAA